MNISYYLFGYARVFVGREHVISLINACMRYNLPYGQTYSVPGGVIFVFRLVHLCDLNKIARSEKIEIKVVKRGGIPFWIYERRKRYGLWTGIVLGVMLIFFSQQFLWRIDVVGNNKVTSGEILELLEDYGLYTGCYIPRIDADRIQNKLLIDSDKVSWISVNINGNTATVEVRETENADREESSGKPAHLTASKSGQIVDVRVMAGNVVVKAGDFVKEGEMLVSGLFESNISGLRIERAQGKVYAQTSREIYIKIPFDYEEKVYTGREYCEKYLNFFDYSVKFSKNSGNEYKLYDKISIVDNYDFFDGEELPLSMTTHRYLEYEYKGAHRNTQEAENLAYFELSEKIGEITEDAILLRKVIVPEIHEDCFALRCVIVCIEDIAKTVEFEVENHD